jgi:ribonuclease HII
MLVAGCDEVGTGALAGPIISVITVFREEDLPLLSKQVRDSKQVSPTMRRSLYLGLCKAAFDVGIGYAFPWEIDKIRYTNALQLSYSRALKDLRSTPEILYMDGVNAVRAWKGRQIVEPKADAKYKQVSAASIIAKVFRDALMAEEGKKHPQYNWAQNHGYGTPDHIEAIEKHGLLFDGQSYSHRRTFCTKLINRLATRSMK